MAFTPISKSAFGGKRFKRQSSYMFAAKDTVTPLVTKELARVATLMPIAFTRIQDVLVPVALVGLSPGTNLFVTPDGRWIGRYIPLVYRSYPFVLAQGPEDKRILCFDEDSGLLSESEGEPFFQENGEPTQAVNETLEFLSQLAANRQSIQRLCALLDKQALIEPWPIKLKDQEDSPERPLDGLYRVNESAFNQLDEKALYLLHRTGAFPLIYCQLISMQHLPVLGEMAAARRRAEQDAALPKNKAGEIDLSFLADDTSISFENL